VAAKKGGDVKLLIYQNFIILSIALLWNFLGFLKGSSNYIFEIKVFIPNTV
jgi:hypothetical protein